ncbi:MAG: two-component regulator propeller domain-containing protein [Salinibacter sp.]|uniref:hybrid sensor histidine kinase/response regulator transcription factor n=1 Tax=Salinibacter sp. TaxID=2065818 RepID=UPI002FC30945
MLVRFLCLVVNRLGPSSTAPNGVPQRVLFVPKCLTSPCARRGGVVLLVLMLGGLTGSAPAQPSTQYVRQSWTVKDGLPQNGVWALEHTNDGFLWTGTMQGLARFDGHDFTIFEPAVTEGLRGNRILHLLERRPGSLWIGTDIGLTRYREGTFTHYRYRGQSLGNVNALYADTAGPVWVASERGLFRRTPDTLARESLPVSLPASSISHLLPAPNDGLWIVAEGTLRRWRDGAFEPSPITRQFSDRNVEAVSRSPEGTWWIGTPSALFRVEADRSLRRYPHSAARIQEIVAPSPRRLWVIGSVDPDPAATDRRRLFRLQNDELVPFPVEGLPPYSVPVSLEPDPSGQVWIGTNGYGLHRLRRRTIGRYPHRQERNGPNTQTIYQDGGGDVWVGTSGQGLTRLSTSDTTTYTVQDGLPSNQIRAVAEDTSGALWVGTSDGLARRTGDAFVVPPEAERLRGHRVGALYQEPNGSFWVGTFGAGLFRRRGDQFERVLSPAALPDAQIYVLRRQPDGPLWIGTYGGGLVAYRAGRMTRYTTTDGLPHPSVRALRAPNDSTLWIGTYGGGLARLRDGHFDGVSKRDGLPNRTVHHILADTSGHFWLASNGGLLRVERDRLRAVANGHTDRIYPDVFGPGDGMPTRECNGGVQPAGWRTRNGRLWVPTIGGAAIVDPDSLDTQPPSSLPVYAVDVRVGDTTYASLSAPLSLTPGTNQIEIRYTGVSLRHSDELWFRYRLAGFTEDWTYTRRRRAAYYTHLPPGTYRFRVQATTDGETWHPARSTVTFTIAPHFWQTWWFRGGIGLLLGVLGVGAYAYRGRSLRRREDRLRTLVNERTQRLTREMKRTEAQAERLTELDTEKNRLFANVSHELRTPLTLILGPLQATLEGSYGPLPDALRPILRRMLRSARRLQALIDQLLDLSTLEPAEVRLDCVRADLVGFLRSVVQAFVPFAEREGITLQFRPRVEAQAVDVDPDKLETAVSNLLSNALKFTPEEGSVLVTLDVHEGDPDSFEIAVHDTGPGLPDEQQPLFFERFHQGGAAESHRGTGIGLALARKVVELHDGTIEVTSTEGTGSTFTVRLPLPDDVAPGDAPDTSANPARSLLDERPLSSTPPVPDPEGDVPVPPTEDPAPEEAPLVLIVEDNDDVQAHLRRHLMDRYRVVEATDGAAGLDAAHKHEPDLVLLDVILPERDGFEVCRALRHDPALGGVPVLMLTARAAEGDSVRGLEAGADAYLTKPFSVAELRAYIDRLLEARATLRSGFGADVLVPDADSTSADEAFLDRVVDSIEAHLDHSSFTVDALAADVGMSPRQLRRRLKTLTGRTPSVVVRTYRLRYAAQLLAADAGTVSEVAYRVGFGTPETFTKHFKEHFDCVPSAYPPEDPDPDPSTGADTLPSPSVSAEADPDDPS